MSIKTILVCLTTPTNADTLVKAAAVLARRHQAHLIGLHTMEALLVYPGIAMHVPGPAFASFNESQSREAEEIEKAFKRHTQSEDFQSEWRLLRSESATAADRMIECARASDLVIMSQEDHDSDRGDQFHVQDRVIRSSGRPVLVIPPNFDSDKLGESVVFGWSDTREATRCAHDLINFVGENSKIRILRVDPPTYDEMADYGSAELAANYARHGISATVVHRKSDGESVSNILIRESVEQGADMIATGAFGHSRTYDFVIGATTSDLLRHAPIPVLFSK